MKGLIDHIPPIFVGLVALAMLFYLVITGQAPADLLTPVLIGALSGLGVDAVHRQKDKRDKGDKE